MFDKTYFRETFIGRVANLCTKGKAMPYEEEKPDYKPHERYMPGYKSQYSSEVASPQRSTTSSSDSAVSAVRSPDHDGSKECPPEMGDKNDPYLVEFTEDDPENPQNWTFGKKSFVTFLICLLTLSVYMGSAIYTPGVMLVAQQFRVGIVTATLGLTLFVIGYGLGPMLGLSAASEIPAIGRTMPYLVTLFIFVVLQVPTALASNISGFMILRFLAGVFGSPPLATGGATMGDLWNPKRLPLALGIWGMAAICGPSLGPVVGGFASQAYGAEGWRWTIWPLLMLSGFALVVLLIFLSETSSANILVRRAKRLRAVTGNPHLRSKGELEQASMSGNEVLMMTLVRPFTLSLTQPIVLGINLHIGLVYGILYLWFEAFPLVFVDIYGFNPGELGLAFMGIFVAALIAYPMFAVWHFKYYEPLYERLGGKVPPEERLWPGIVGAFFIPICMFGFAWTATASIHWMVPIFFSGFFTIGTFGLFNAGLSYLGDCYPDYIASVYAGNDFARSMIGGALPLVARAMFTNLQANGPKAFPVAWGSVLMGCISIAMIPIPFALYKFGPKLRTMSKYAMNPNAQDEEKDEKHSSHN